MDGYGESPQQKRNFWIVIGIMVVGAAACCLLVICK